MDTAIASFPSEGWAKDARDLLAREGIASAVEYHGPRAWQLVLDRHDAAAASFALADLRYLVCEGA